MLPSITAIKRMTALRNCASKFCAYTENGRQPLSCNATTAGNLDKIFEQCKGARPDHCPSATCARMLNHAATREAWYRCRHDPQYGRKHPNARATLLSALEACQRFLEPGCVDHPKSFRDPDGDTCINYVEKGVCRDGELLVSEADLHRGCNAGECKSKDGFFANTACCACGGGQSQGSCNSAEGNNCTKAFVDGGCADEELPLHCVKYESCFERECAVLPMRKGEAMMGSLKCRKQKESIDGELVFYDVEPGSVSATFTIENVTHHDKSVEPKVTSQKTCAELKWDGALPVNEMVTFTDTDGDRNTYIQTKDKGLEAFVQKGPHGVKMKEGRVQKFSYKKSKLLLDDSYGVMKLNKSTAEEILPQLAKLAKANNVSGLEMAPGREIWDPVSCMSGTTCKAIENWIRADGICRTYNARMCSPEEVIGLTDKKMCAIKSSTPIWTNEKCGEGKALAVKFNINLPPGRDGKAFTRKSVQAGIKITCEKKSTKAFAMCCADTKVAITKDNVEALKGTYDYQDGHLALRANGYAFASIGHKTKSFSLEGRYDRKTLVFQGTHNLCSGGTFNFTENVSVNGYSQLKKDGYSFLKEGECRCHHGASPASATIDQKLLLPECIQHCNEFAQDESCMAVSHDSESKSCILYFDTLNERIEKKYKNTYPGMGSSGICDIVKTSIKNNSEAKCYLKEGPSVRAPFRFYGHNLPMLACADAKCHPELSGCQLDDLCVGTIVRIAQKSCYNRTCLENAAFEAREELGGEKDGESAATKDLLACMAKHRCARTRAEVVDDEDTDVAPQRLRVGYALTMDNGLKKRMENKIDFEKTFISEIADSLTESENRFVYTKEEEDDQGKSILIVFEILEGNWNEPGSSIEKLYTRLRWMVANKHSPLYWKNHTLTAKSAGQVVLLEHHLGLNSHFHSNSHQHHHKAETFISGVIGALLGSLLILCTLFLGFRYQKEALLTHLLGLRVGRRVLPGSSTEMQHLAAEFEEKFPMKQSSSGKGRKMQTRMRYGGRTRDNDEEESWDEIS